MTAKLINLKHKRNRQKRQRMINLSLVLMIIASLLMLFYCNINAAETINVDTGKYVVVQRGQSLWAIAKEIASEKDDVRRIVYDITKYNNLDSEILSVGQKIFLPPKYLL